MDSLEALLQACTVQILFPGLDGWGTGFFVAPDLVLTCAHVVKDLGDGEARLRWQQQPDFARAKLVQFLLEADVALLWAGHCMDGGACRALSSSMRRSSLSGSC